LILSLVRFRRRDGDSVDGVAVKGIFSLNLLDRHPRNVVLFVGHLQHDIYDRMGGISPSPIPIPQWDDGLSVASSQCPVNSKEAGTPRSGGIGAASAWKRSVVLPSM